MISDAEVLRELKAIGDALEAVGVVTNRLEALRAKMALRVHCDFKAGDRVVHRSRKDGGEGGVVSEVTETGDVIVHFDGGTSGQFDARWFDLHPNLLMLEA